MFAITILQAVSVNSALRFQIKDLRHPVTGLAALSMTVVSSGSMEFLMHLTDGHFSPYVLFAFLVSGHWGVTSPHCHSRRASVHRAVEVAATFFWSIRIRLRGRRRLRRGETWWPFPPGRLLWLSESPRRPPLGGTASTCCNIRSCHRPLPSGESAPSSCPSPSVTSEFPIYLRLLWFLLSDLGISQANILSNHILANPMS